MIDKNTFKDCIKKIALAYENFELTKEQLEMWYEMLGDMKEKDFNLMITEYIKTNKYKPNIAMLRECLKEYKENNPYAGWEVIR